MRRLVLLALALAPIGVLAQGRVVRVEDTTRNREVRVPAGVFTMGVDPNAVEAAKTACNSAFDAASGTLPNGQRLDFCADYYDDLSAMSQRDVYLDAFMIDRYEVSVRDYRACVARGACDLDALVSGDERYIRDDWPMVNVTWDEAQAYCRWKGGRLPTEAEWERAARGDEPGAIWPWGEREQPKDFNHGQRRAHAMQQIERIKQTVPYNFFGDPDDSDGHVLIAAPGSYVWGQSPFGTHDQAGNVAEWTADAYVFTNEVKGYQKLSAHNPLRDAASPSAPRVVRGGSWRQPAFIAKSNLRDPFNGLYEANRRFAHIGFRCARGIATTPFWEREKPRDWGK